MPPTLTTTAPQRTAIVHVTCRREEIQKVMGPGIGELMQVVQSQGVPITGPWFTHHRRRPTDTFDFDIGVPVGAAVKPQGRVAPGELRARKAAHTTHVGPYDGLGAAWGAFQQWLEANGHRAVEDLIEVYAVGPESVQDPKQYRTELYQPLER